MKCKKSILIFIDWFLPGTKAGGPVRSVANMTDHLEQEFSFKIVCRNTDYCSTTPYQNIIPNKWQPLNSFTQVLYLSKKKTTTSNIYRILKNTDYDILYINGIYSFYFSILPIVFSRLLNRKTIVAARGMLSAQALEVKSAKKKAFLKLISILNLYKNIVFQATVNTEQQDIKKQFPRNKVVIAPNLHRKIQEKELPVTNKENGKVKLFSLARISPEKNTLFAIECLQTVRSEVIFDLYGEIYNEAYWTLCKNVIENLPDNITVNHKGSVDSAQIPIIISQYHFAFMPSLGENFGHAILESLCSGRTVIISDKTPWQNLQEKGIGWDISLSSSSNFTKTIEICATFSQNDFNIYCQKAFNFAQSYIGNTHSIEQNKQLFNNL